MSILDAHVHFWDPRTTPRAVSALVRVLGFSPRLVDWVARRVFPADARRFFASPRFITRPYLPADLRRDAGELELRSVVHVEAGWEGRDPLAPVGETRWLDGLATGGGVQIGAIVAHADLGRGAAVAEVLRAHVAASARVRGVRDMLAWHPSRGVLDSAKAPEKSRDAEWRRGFEELSDLRLTFEATCYDHQLAELAELARAYPEQPILLSHSGTPVAIGGPFADLGRSTAERDAIFGRWRDGMARLAECRNVAVKISGLLMPVCGFGFETRREPPSAREVADALRPLVAFVLETFGVERCQFASNFPVEKVAVPYGTLWSAYRDLVAGYGPADRDRLLGGNAASYFGI